MFLALALDQGQGKRRGVNWDFRDLFQQEGNPADVVFVAVADNQGLDLVPVLDQVRVVGDDVVDP